MPTRWATPTPPTAPHHHHHPPPDLVRVEHSLRDQEGPAGGAGQDRHGELHRQAGGGEGRPWSPLDCPGRAGKGGVRSEDHLSDGGETRSGAEAGEAGNKNWLF